MKLNLLVAAILTAVCVPLANGQAAPADKNPEKISGVGGDANFSQLVSQQHGSMQFTGKVVVDGARPVWSQIPIVVTCGGKARYNTVADAKGGFGILLDAKLPDSEIVKTKSDLKRV